MLGVSSKIVDFGKVNTVRTKNLSLSVTATNEGKRPLVLQKADVSCGCMDVKFGKSVLRADESTQIQGMTRTSWKALPTEKKRAAYIAFTPQQKIAFGRKS